MGWSFPLGRILGSEVRVHATFFLLLAWIGAAAWVSGGPAAAAHNILFVISLFACVVAHEFGHALMARRYGIKTPDITILPIGGLARLERLPEEPAREVAVALAGPAVNVLIWLFLVLFAGAGGGLGSIQELEAAEVSFLDRLAAVNLFLAAFNLLPAFPMDGGRVLRAVLAARLGRTRATRIAASAGQTLAFGFGVLGLMYGNPLLLLIAVFVWFAASSESTDVAMQEVARTLRARDAMITAFESLVPEDRLHVAGAALIRTTQHEFPVLGPTGRLEGFLTRSALLHAYARGDQTIAVAEVMQVGIPTVQMTTRLDIAIREMQKAMAPALGVTDAEGHLVGYITAENMGELLMIRNPR